MKMNKKVLSMFVVGVLALGLGSAFLVSYLSNTIKGDVSIDSPFDFQISLAEDGTYGESVTFEDTYGGNTITAYTKLTNNADVTISDRPVSFIITNDNDTSFEGNEFVVEAFTFGGIEAGAVNCEASTGKTQLVCTTGVVTLNAHDTQEIMFNVTANVAIEPDTYTFEAKVLTSTD